MFYLCSLKVMSWPRHRRCGPNHEILPASVGYLTIARTGVSCVASSSLWQRQSLAYKLAPASYSTISEKEAWPAILVNYACFGPYRSATDVVLHTRIQQYMFSCDYQKEGINERMDRFKHMKSTCPLIPQLLPATASHGQEKGGTKLTGQIWFGWGPFGSLRGPSQTGGGGFRSVPIPSPDICLTLYKNHKSLTLF